MPFPTPIMRLSAQGQYKTLYGPKYHYQPNFKGITSTNLYRFGIQSAPYGAAALVAVLFYASGIPRVQRDILQKIPFIGNYFIKEVHPADSPF